MQNLIQNYGSKEKQKELAKAIMFYTMVNTLRRDFAHVRQFVGDINKEYFPVPIGKEAGRLTGALIVLDAPKNIHKDNCEFPHTCKAKIDIFNDFLTKSDDNLEERLYRELHHTERASIFNKNYMLWLNAKLDNYRQNVKVSLKELAIGSTDINKNRSRFLGNTYKGKRIGTRTSTALCAAVGLRLPIITASKTVRGQKRYDVKVEHKGYSLIGTGTVRLFDSYGLEREAYLEIDKAASTEQVIGEVSYNNKNYPVICRELIYGFDKTEKRVKLHQRRILPMATLDAIRQGNIDVVKELI